MTIGCSEVFLHSPVFIHRKGVIHVSHSFYGCLLENLHILQLAHDWNDPKFIHFCNRIWTQYSLYSKSKEPSNDILDPNVFRDIYRYYR